MATITSPRSQSPSITPVSSVRPSLDLSTNGRSSSPAPAAQRRNRAALRDYYNLSSKAPAPPNLSRTASITSTTSDGTVTSNATLTDPTLPSDGPTLTSQLDDADFDADAYISDLLQTSSLKSVLRTEATLVSEIKNLDGERKALVYDNYSKLIKATQTIGNMQKSMSNAAGVGNLQSMEKLQPAIEGIARMVQDLSKTGQVGESAETNAKHRQMRAEAKAQQRKKETVRWVLRAPIRLKNLLDDGRGSEMEAEWKVVSGILDDWDGAKGVEELRAACEQIVSRKEAEDG